MGEGVDPTEMCQSLVNKVAQSEQLQSVASPDVLILFEDWMEELERETLALIAGDTAPEPEKLASALGISDAGAQFLITKLRKEGKLEEAPE